MARWKVTVDPKYPQAMGIATIMDHVSVFGNSPWEILHNSEAENPFFTSDYPAAIEVTNLNAPINRIVPSWLPTWLSAFGQTFACPVRSLIAPLRSLEAVQRGLKRAEVVDLNRLLVRCAEDLIIYREDRAWIEGFVAKIGDTAWSR